MIEKTKPCDSKKKKTVKCSQVCGLWDSYDKDCEIYGENHCPPRTCFWFHKEEPELYEKLFEKDETRKE